MCPPHCGDFHDDDRAIMHWPAPDARLAESMLRAVAISTVVAAIVGLAFCAIGLARQLVSIRRRERVELDLSTLRGAFAMAVATALGPSLLACVWALVVSNHFNPLRTCNSWSGASTVTRVATLLAVAGPLATFVVQTRPAKYEVHVERSGDVAAGYRTAPLVVARFADAGRARRLVLRCFALRLGLAALGVLVIWCALPLWGVPYTPRLFELTWSALFVLAFHLPTRVAVDGPLDCALRRAQLTGGGATPSSSSPLGYMVLAGAAPPGSRSTRRPRS
jgi:hypothetical protein